MTPAVFLDRDGTVSVEMGYIHEQEIGNYRLLPGAAAGMKRLQQAGYKLVLVTNQSGVARGYYPEATVHRVHARLRVLLGVEGVKLDATYFCPHHPDPSGPTDTGDAGASGAVKARPVEALAYDCECRKPKAGMGRDAARDLDLDLSRSWMIGDKSADLGFAKNLGVRSILVRSGYGERTLAKLKEGGEALPPLAADLQEAAKIILDAV